MDVDTNREHIETWSSVLRANRVFLADNLRRRDVLYIVDYLYQECCVDYYFVREMQRTSTSRKAMDALLDQVHYGGLRCITAYLKALVKLGREDMMHTLHRLYDEHYPVRNCEQYGARPSPTWTNLCLQTLSTVISATHVYVHFLRSTLFKKSKTKSISVSSTENNPNRLMDLSTDHVNTWKLALRVNRVFLMDHLRKREVTYIADLLFQERCVDLSFFSHIERATASPKAVVMLMDHVHQSDGRCVTAFCTALKKLGRDDVLQKLQDSYCRHYPVLDPEAYDRRPPPFWVVSASRLLSATVEAVNAYALFLTGIHATVVVLMAALLRFGRLLIFWRKIYSSRQLLA